MEYIDGDTLDKIIEPQGGRPRRVAECLDWAIDLLEVLFYLHQHKNGYIHRDIKPANIKIRYDNHRAVLLDFGIAKEEAQGTQIDGSYSPEWAAPEQLRSYEDGRYPAVRSKTEPRSDLYSFAATFYYVLTGAMPAPAGARIRKDKPVSLISIRDLDAAIPERIAQVIMSAMVCE